ncbi:MAG: antibiotic biosynthesis monooxygenase [Pseudomonadota bacterium]
MAKIILKGHIVIPKADLITVREELVTHIELTRQEPGCLVFEIEQDSTDEHTFHVYEEFANREAFEAHQDRVKASRWGQVSRNVVRHFEVTECDS